MKKLFSLLALALLFALPAFLVTGCNKPEDDVKAVFEKFTKAAVEGNFDEMEKYVTKDSASKLAVLKMMMSMSDSEKKEMFRSKAKEVLDGIKIEKITITGDGAVVVASGGIDGGRREEQTFNFRKEDGQWKIVVPMKPTPAPGRR